jgi:hypothetical protein
MSPNKGNANDGWKPFSFEKGYQPEAPTQTPAPNTGAQQPVGQLSNPVDVSTPPGAE